MNTCAVHILCGTIHITHSMPSIIIVSSQKYSLVSYMGSEWCNRDNRMQTLHSQTRTYAYTICGWIICTYISARSKWGIWRHHTFTYILHALQSFINLPFRLSLLAALHVLNACMKMIIISVLNLIHQHLNSSSFSNRQFHPLLPNH